MATRQMVQEIYELLAAPLLPGDAIICTSKSVRDVVRFQFDLAQEVGWAKPHQFPELPVVPLGIDSAAFKPCPSYRACWRDKLKLGSDDLMFSRRQRVFPPNCI